ncbi:unnamed protein product [Protopolystoma xenopodis]|uniref:Uncharacterized protein n=1 Tax=Protopolystoma xenopodis TaxID=117903 RepID=A0A448XB36_9PLAT|nr:unnamed protein product [Protopolystoma xenopodis]
MVTQTKLTVHPLSDSEERLISRITRRLSLGSSGFYDPSSQICSNSTVAILTNPVVVSTSTSPVYSLGPPKQVHSQRSFSPGRALSCVGLHPTGQSSPNYERGSLPPQGASVRRGDNNASADNPSRATATSITTMDSNTVLNETMEEQRQKVLVSSVPEPPSDHLDNLGVPAAGTCKKIGKSPSSTCHFVRTPATDQRSLNKCSISVVHLLTHLDSMLLIWRRLNWTPDMQGYLPVMISLIQALCDTAIGYTDRLHEKLRLSGYCDESGQFDIADEVSPTKIPHFIFYVFGTTLTLAGGSSFQNRLHAEKLNFDISAFSTDEDQPS